MRGYARFVLIGLLILGLFCGGAMGAPSITGLPASNPSTTTGDMQIFNVTMNETCNVTWYMNGSNVATNTSVTFDEYSNNSAPAGDYNVTAVAENLNGTVQKEWIWTVSNVSLSIDGFNPSSPIGSTVGGSQEFNITTNQDAIVKWYIDNSLVQTNSSASSASYVNNTAPVGSYNITAVASNVNGTPQNEWTWNVLPMSAPSITAATPPSPVSKNTGESITFSVTADQAVNATWILNGTTVQINNTLPATTASYSNNSVNVGVYNLTVFLENANGNVSTKWTMTVTNESLSITGSNPASPTDSFEGMSQEFNVTTNQDSIVKWYINGALTHTNASAKVASYVNTTSSIGSYNITAIATNVNGTVQKKWDWDVRSKTYYTGDRIWDALTSPSLIYTWNAKSFSGFYYDLDSGMGSESMEIKLTSGSRTVGRGNLKYSTTPINTNFERTAWGNYSIIGFMAERYFAGYPSGTFGLTSDINLISSGQMSKVLINEEKSRSVYAGSALILEDGYTLNVVEVDKNGDKVFISLTKDGSELASAILSSGTTYVYEKDLGSADDVPIVVVHFDNIFQGAETSAVFVKGIFQISDEYITVKNGDSYGKMEITSTSGKIEMENDNSFTLSRGNTIDIMGKIKFLVADSSTIRFAPFVDMTEPGTYELRGTVAENEKYKWTPLNFEGFYYSMDDGKWTESLEVESLSGTTIPADKLVYKAVPTAVSFEHGAWKTYDVVGFMAENYFAGYPSTTTFVGSTVSMISNGQLSKVLINEDKSRAIHSGSGLILDEGYVLNIIEVDKNGNKVAVSLSKDGSEIGDMSIVTAGNTYVYEKDLGSSDDVPIIAVHFDQIFQGAESSAVFVDGIFQISDQYITVEDGDTYGKMEVTSTSGKIEMRNDDSISLTRGKSISIMGDILFKVADDSVNVRYYPYVEISTAPLDSLDISMPTSVKQGDDISIVVTSRGATVSDVAVKFDDDNVGKTSAEGTISYKPALSGTYTVTAEKDGYVSASGQVEVISPLDETKKMSIEVSPDVVYEGNQLTISTIKAIGGEAIEDVDVSYDGKSLGTTSADGTLSYTVKEPGMHKLTATKTGYLDAELNLEVLALEAKFEFSNLVVSPLEVKMGKDVTITLDASNTGKAEGEYNVDLMINGNLTESRTVTLAVDESTIIEFTVAKDEPGTYLVEVNGLSGTFEVLEKTGSVALYVLGILGVFAAIAVGYMFTAGGWTVEMVSTKVAEFIESIR